MKKFEKFERVALPVLLYTGLLSFASAEERNIVRKDIELESKTGIMIRGYLEGNSVSLENGEKCPLIVLLHGLMDSNEFDLIRKQADLYEDADYAVLAFDFNGHGKSDGATIDMTISKELLDAETIMDYAVTLPFVSKLYLAGHSQGGAVASMTAPKYQDKLDGLILLAPGGFIPDMLRSGNFFGIQGDVNDPPEKVEVFEDCFVGREYFLDGMRLDVYGEAGKLRYRDVLIVNAGEDSEMINEEVTPAYEKLYTEGGCRVSRIMIDDAPHDFAGHEPELAEAVLSFMDHTA